MTQSSTFFNNDHGLDNVPIPLLGCGFVEESHHNDNSGTDGYNASPNLINTPHYCR